MLHEWYVTKHEHNKKKYHGEYYVIVHAYTLILDTDGKYDANMNGRIRTNKPHC